MVALDSSRWTPTCGHVVGWPFVWRNRKEQAWYDRPCLCLSLKGEQVLLFAFTNPNNSLDFKPLSVRWDNFSKREFSKSFLSTTGLQVNVLQPDDVPVFDMNGNHSLYGQVDNEQIQHITKRVFGGLVAGIIKPVVGVRRTGVGEYQNVALDVSPAREIYVRDVKGQTQGLL